MKETCLVGTVLVTLLILIRITVCQLQASPLTPPYFNLAAVSRSIAATATCGEGISEPQELYCHLTGALGHEASDDVTLIQGQFCDHCIPTNPTKSHPPAFAVDGTERWWMSPPLSRGLQYNEVNVTIDLGQEFNVAYVFLKMGNSPRPGVWALERTKDYGHTWLPWQYFADTPSDCVSFFGKDAYKTQITSDDTVVCTTEFSKIVPLKGGEIVVSLVNNRPSAHNFSYSKSLQEWTRATGIRLRFLRTKTTLGHLMAVARQDPSVTRRYYYTLKDISIGGRCVCNGHADACDMADPDDPKRLVCRCQHNTCGTQCETCCPGFVQKPWRPVTQESLNECEPCQCYGHADECVYDEKVAAEKKSIDIHGRYDGGGVCLYCRHNTEGVNCEKCRPGYYRQTGTPLDSPNVCRPCRCNSAYSTGECEMGTGKCTCKPQFTGTLCEKCNVGYYGFPICTPCDCHFNGTVEGVCEVGGGQCPCKHNYAGNNCDECAEGYFGFPNCTRCNCGRPGSASDICDINTGECSCLENYASHDCTKCADGYFNYPICSLCNCETSGTTSAVCDKDTGECLCEKSFTGSRCEACAVGHYRFPTCAACQCNEHGSEGEECDAFGQCVCLHNFGGRTCDRCAAGFYRFPECLPCHCDNFGSYDVTCDQETGQCNCRPTFQSGQCNKCRPTYYNYPICEECNCNPAGAKEIPGYPLGGCGEVTSGQLCECKERVTGRECETCKPGFWNLDIRNPDACQDCNCSDAGSISGSNICDTVTGQCVCKTYVNSLQCTRCADGTYNLQHYNVFGCEDCKCNPGGSVDMNCNKETGQCNCKPRATGLKCDRVIANHYYPGLFQHLYEMEDGHTPSGGVVRYNFDSYVFPGFSWRGYAVLSRIQEEVIVDVTVTKPSLYRLLFSYVNLNENNVVADITVTPETSTDVQQTSNVVFAPTAKPQFVTVSGAGVPPTPFVLNPGHWTISLKAPENLLVDYLVLLPQAYYEPAILGESTKKPCTCPATDEICRHYVYVDMSKFPLARGEEGYVEREGVNENTQLFEDVDLMRELETSSMAYLDENQNTLSASVSIPSSGKYVFVVQFRSNLTDRGQKLNVEISSQSGSEVGEAMLPDCPYCSLCRKLVTSENGDPIVVNIEDNYAVVTLSGDDTIRVAIDAIIAVPVTDWSLEYLTPKLKCVRRDKKCIESQFITPTGTVKIEVESRPNEDLVETDVPPSITDTSVKVIKVDSTTTTLNVKSIVQNPGDYVFVIHYYQPYHTTIDVVTNVTAATLYPGKFLAEFCPSTSGCRMPVSFKDNGNGISREIVDDFVVSFDSSSTHPVWLDYILVIPLAQYTPEVLNIQSIDLSVDFIKKCGYNNFYIDKSSSAACRQAVYVMSTDYNNGGLECDCNPQGSLSFQCDEYNGQCRCRPNVIGRTCVQCKTGFYGFPNCRQCNCPSGLCDPRTGQCVCPPFVTGPDCNICLPQTFGFDLLIGCEECNCEPDGVVGNNLDCEINSGQCNCKPNIGGRRCNQCVAGYYQYPYCQQCSCDIDGTTPDICDQKSADCLCKENVEGPQCTDCIQSTFYLENRNPKGCTKCFCFGTTTVCDSSDLRRKQVRDMTSWGITNLKSYRIEQSDSFTIAVHVDESEYYYPDDALYWVAPATYLRNKVTSYGGKLIYAVEFQLPSSGRTTGIVKPDVRIEGHNLTIVHISPEQPSPGETLTVELDLLETKFVHESSGAAVTREQFMMVLAAIKALHIRASYYTVVTYVSLSDVHMDTASEDGTGEVARNVEQCQCPRNYIGTSCETCAPGYYRQQSGSFLGVCVPCQCHGRADDCDRDTGTCKSCRDNYDGPQCLTCKQGFYEDPTSGSCRICACPLGLPSNNFAATCEVGPRGVVIRCQCLPGYSGPRCESCDHGYWGNPNILDGGCKPCDCTGNIDIHDPTSCDISTGACLKCIHNTAGERCERCQDWYYGDAVDLKSCKPCPCNTLGTAQCDHNTGTCVCKPNVIGMLCDKCAPGTYGLDSGNGCTPCNCATASYGQDCDPKSGQCRCKPYVTGRRCDSCEQNYWNYQPAGCTRCQCDFDSAVTCNPLTGQCTCLPGVTGAKCDQCLDRWVLIKDKGCFECDNCVHLLLDDIEELDSNVTIIRKDLNTISVGAWALVRLQKINETVYQLRPKVDSLQRDPADTQQFESIKVELKKLLELSESTRTKADKAVREAKSIEHDSEDLLIESESLKLIIDIALNVSQDAVIYVKDILRDIMNSIHDANIAELLRQAEEILVEIRRRDFTVININAENELDLALKVLEKAKSLLNQAMEHIDRKIAVQKKIESLEGKLLDLMNNSRHSLDFSQLASELNERNLRTKTTILETVEKIRISADNARMMLNMGKELVEKAKRFLEEARKAYMEAEEELSKLDQAMIQLEVFIESLAEENTQLRPLVQNATEHAYKLKRQAETLESLIRSTKESAEGALNASRAYQAIVDGIDRAWNASNEAVDAAMKAEELSNGLAEQARKSKERSLELKSTADSTKQTVTTVLQPRLNEAKKSTEYVSQLNIKIREEITFINQGIGSLPSGGYAEQARIAAQKAMDAKTKADEAKRKIEIILNKLPQDLQRAKDIPKFISEVNSIIHDTQLKVKQVVELVPEAKELIVKLKERSDRIHIIGTNLGFNVSALREKITIARGEASRIGVGLLCQKTTGLQVRTPQNLLQAESHTKIQLYFRTSKPDGVLAYIGADQSSNFGKPDFVALEVINSNVVFKFDLGGGPAIITVAKNVSDGKWHEVIAERTGNSGIVRVRSNEEADVENRGESPGTFSVFDIRADGTKFFIGGIPSTSAGLQEKLKSLHFEGCIEDVKFGGLPVGLWDFVYGEANNMGCYERDVLPEPAVDSYHFNGNGFVKIAQENFKPTRDTRVLVRFRSFAENGLILLMEKKPDFLSLELHDGKILFQYNLGSGTAKVETREKYNDGKEHVISANRVGQQGLLRIDDTVETQTLKSPGSLKDLDINPAIFVGGYQGKHTLADVTQQGFEGCILEVTLASTRRNLGDNLLASGIVPGCVQVARIVHFNPEVEKSYVAMERVSIDNKFSMTFKMKTTEKEGLLFYTADDTQENSMSISIVNGRIFVIVNNGGIRTMLESNATNYNDGRWHYISVTKLERDVQLDIDDVFIEKKTLSGSLRKLTTTTPLYFGGAPSNIPSGQLVVRENIGTSTHFLGCLGDVTVNGNFTSFADLGERERPGAILTGCPKPDPAVVTTPAPSPSVPPTPSLPSEMQRCGLPIKPEEEDASKVGIRFGLQPGSRAIYSNVPAVDSQKSTFSLELKTLASNGLIFFASEKTHKDFVMLTIQGGKLVYTFSCGEEPATITTSSLYNDNQWHTVEFSRVERSGRLIVDNKETKEGATTGERISLDLETPFYLGGVSDDAVEHALLVIQENKQSLVGCLRNFKSGGQLIGPPTSTFATESCTSAEAGAFFYTEGGYIKLSDNFKVGLDLDIKLDFKPRTMSGVLLSVYSPTNGEYLVLQMVNGEVLFSVENGKGEIFTKFEPPLKNQLCDGNWHTLKAVKAKNVLTLNVDSIAASAPGLGTLERSTDTNDPLYIGGIPSMYKGIKTQDQYVGCLRNLIFNTTLQNFQLGHPMGRVNQRTCPIN